MAKAEKVYIVEAPVKNFCGVGAAGVQFAYGKAEVNEGWVLNWYREHGYKVTAKEAEKEAEKEADETDKEAETKSTTKTKK
jgi:hypothetical protein